MRYVIILAWGFITGRLVAATGESSGLLLPFVLVALGFALGTWLAFVQTRNYYRDLIKSEYGPKRY